MCTDGPENIIYIYMWCMKLYDIQEVKNTFTGSVYPAREDTIHNLIIFCCV